MTMPRHLCCMVLIVATSLGAISASLFDGMVFDDPDMDPTCMRADLVFVLDSSASIGARNWLKVLQFVKGIVKNMIIGPNNIQVGVVTFGNRSQVQFDLDTYSDKTSLMDAIDQIPWLAQATNTSGALYTMRTHMFRPERGDRFVAPNIAVVITDGESNREPNKTLPEAQLSRDAGIAIFSLGIGDDVNTAEVEGIGSEPRDQFVHRLENFDLLQMFYIDVIELTCLVRVDCRDPADVVFVLDSSHSMRPDNFRLMTHALASLMNDQGSKNFTVTANRGRVGLLTFSTTPRVNFHLNEYKNDSRLLNAMRSAVYNPGKPNIAEALRTLRNVMFTPEHGDRDDHRNVAVIFTDAASTSYRDTLSAAAEAKASGIALVVVSIGNWINPQETNGMASLPTEANVIPVMDFQSLRQAIPLLKEAVCNDILECSSSPCANGGVCVDGIHTYYCRCPPMFMGPNCMSVCREPADIVVALDSSYDIDREDYSAVLGLVRTLALNLNDETMRLGVETYADEARVRFHLNTYDHREDWLEALRFPSPGGATNTAAALRTMREDMFSRDFGDRPEVRNLGILITDGGPGNRSATFWEAVRMRDETTLVAIAVNVNAKYDQKELKTIVSYPHERNLFNVDSYESLAAQTDILSNILLDIACNQNDECDSAPCGDHGKCEDKLNTHECLCHPGWTGPNCDKECDGLADIVFILDVSGGIRLQRFAKVKDWVASVISQLEVHPLRTRVAVISFNESVVTEFTLDTFRHKEDVMHAVTLIPYRSGRTNIAGAIRRARYMFHPSTGDRENAPNFAVFVTDGGATVNVDLTLREAAEARLDGVHLMVVSPEGGADSLEFRGIASQPVSSNIFTVRSYDDLPMLTNTVIDAMCDSHNECYDVPCQHGGTCINALHTYICLCPQQYTGRNCQRECTRRYDVVLVMDSSLRTERDFALSQDLARLLVYGFNFVGGRTRVGAMTYSETPVIRFHLNSHLTQEEVLNSLAFQRGRGRTNTRLALQRVRSHMFTPQDGDRQLDPNIIILITDGHSSIKSSSSEWDKWSSGGARVMVVGRSEHVSLAELSSLASLPYNENVFLMTSRAQLRSTADAILNELCQ